MLSKSFLAVFSLLASSSALTLKTDTYVKVIGTTDDSLASIPAASALFGQPAYAGKLYGEVVTLKKEETDTFSGCMPYNTDEQLKVKGKILLVDRGECSFVTKALNAQLAGAASVIVVDKRCTCDADYMTKDECKNAVHSPMEKVCADFEPYLKDDGRGSGVSLSMAMIDLHNGLEIFRLIKAGPVQVALKWNKPDPQRNVKYELWTSSEEITLFKEHFRAFAYELRDRTEFEPHMFVWDGREIEPEPCQKIDENGQKSNQCSNQCLGKGLYCNPDPDRDLDTGLSGANIIQENLRQLCIWEQVKGTFKQDGGEKWWDYVGNFTELCIDPFLKDDKFDFHKCSQDLHSQVKLDWSKTSECVKFTPDDTHPLLDKQMAERTSEERHGGPILQLPTVIVNGLVERGGVNTLSVMKTICAGFDVDGRPPICGCIDSSTVETLGNCITGIKCPNVDDLWCSSKNTCVKDVNECAKPPMSGGSIFFIILTAVAVIVAGAVVYNRHTKKELREDMQNILSEYMPLEEMNGGRGSSSEMLTGNSVDRNVGLI